MKRLISVLVLLAMALSLVACGAPAADTGIKAPDKDVAMQYMSPEELKNVLGSDEYVIFDVRKAADHLASHIPGSIGVDMDAAKEGDFQAGVNAMKSVVSNLDKKLVLVCYSGKRYAQATTNVLSALGYDMSKVYTLEGGFTKWSETYADDVQTADEVVAPAEDVAMQYITAEELKNVLGSDEYTIFDVRKAADNQASHIPGSIGVDMDAAKEGDFQAGVSAMKPAIAHVDNKLVLVCYSGKRYAQATTNVLSALGYDMSKVYTLEGGFTKWTETYPNVVEPIKAPEKDVAMQYMTAEEAKGLLGNSEYTFFDVRKAADYQNGHIPGALGYDMDAAKEGNFDAGVATMKEAIAGVDNKLVLVCYSGKRYAQATTNVLSALGYDMSKVYTLEGGFTKWSETYPDVVETVPAVDQRRVYVTADWVKSVMDGNQPESANYVILDVAYPATAADYEAYGKGHIPGAVYASIMEVEDATGDNVGAYNLLSAEQIRDYAMGHGIDKDTTVIMYGPDISGTARQAYGYLYIGVENVKILNGGLAAWEKAGYELETKANKGKAVKSFGTDVPANPQYWTSIEDALTKTESDPNFKLVSIRSREEFLGETSGYGYMDKAGEPKGAVWGKGPLTSGDVAQFTNEDGTVKELADIADLWADCDFQLTNHLAFYCGTGWRACVPFLMMYQEGYDDISVFDGGWYQWLMDDSNPVQVGDPATGNVTYTTVGELPTGMAAK